MGEASRRIFLAQAGAVAALPFVSGCGAKLDQAAVLRALVLDVVVPNARALVSESRQLDRAMRALSETNDRSALAAAQEPFQKTLLAWKRSYAFRLGPFATSNVFLRAAFWPSRPKAIDAVLGSERLIDGALIESLGVDAKGLFGLEYLLFGAGDADTRGALAERRTRYAFEVSSNVLSHAERTARMLGDGRSYALAFASAGADSVNQLVAQMVDTVELVVGKLTRILRFAASGALRASDVEGYFSGTSLQIALELLKGTESLYVGQIGAGGLGDRVALVSPAIDARVRAAFVAARRKLEALGAPLERSVKERPTAMNDAVSALRALEVAMRIDLRSALGITLTFASGDGD